MRGDPRPIAWRHQHRITQAQLADLLGVDVATVGRWESGQSRPRRKAWPDLDQFDAGLIGVAIPDAGPAQFVPAHDLPAWELRGEVRFVTPVATPAPPVLPDIGTSTAEELRRLALAILDRLDAMDGAGVSELKKHAHASEALTPRESKSSLASEMGTATARKARLGRPPLPGGGGNRISAYLGQDQVDEIERHQRRLGCSQNAAIRILISRGAEASRDDKPDTHDTAE